MFQVTSIVSSDLKKVYFFQLVCFILFDRAYVLSVSHVVSLVPSHSARNKYVCTKKCKIPVTEVLLGNCSVAVLMNVVRWRLVGLLLESKTKSLTNIVRF